MADRVTGAAGRSETGPGPARRPGTGWRRGRVAPWLVAALGVSPAVASVAQAEDRAPVTVRMGETGFRPNSVEIHEGEAVVFENTGREPHWPASAIHPAHQVYPEFDPRRPILAGERWAFRFERPGTFPFHDHLNPEAQGAVVVTARPVPALVRWSERLAVGVLSAPGTAYDRLLVAVSRLYYRLRPERQAEVVAHLDVRRIAQNDDDLQYWLAVLGPAEVMAALLERSGGGAVFYCHQEAHQIGRVAYRLQGASAFQAGSASCDSGYYHGVLEGLLHDRGTENLPAEVDRLCHETGALFVHYQCVHGVGHGVMAYQGYDLPRALDTCRRLTEGRDQGWCAGGVFMENIVAGQGAGALRGHRTAWLSQDPHFPCNAIDPTRDFLLECYHIQTSWMLTVLRDDFAAVARECLRAPERMRVVCFNSYGRDASGRTLRDPGRTAALCAAVPSEGDYRDWCIRGAIDAIVNFWGDAVGNQPAALCRQVAEASKARCYGAIVTLLPVVFADSGRRREVCRTFETPYARLCPGA
jgi:plastocyanin